jgi:hypothetical protein
MRLIVVVVNTTLLFQWGTFAYTGNEGTQNGNVIIGTSLYAFNGNPDNADSN